MTVDLAGLGHTTVLADRTPQELSDTSHLVVLDQLPVRSVDVLVGQESSGMHIVEVQPDEQQPRADTDAQHNAEAQRDVRPADKQPSSNAEAQHVAEQLNEQPEESQLSAHLDALEAVDEPDADADALSVDNGPNGDPSAVTDSLPAAKQTISANSADAKAPSAATPTAADAAKDAHAQSDTQRPKAAAPAPHKAAPELDITLQCDLLHLRCAAAWQRTAARSLYTAHDPLLSTSLFQVHCVRRPVQSAVQSRLRAVAGRAAAGAGHCVAAHAGALLVRQALPPHRAPQPPELDLPGRNHGVGPEHDFCPA